MKNVQLLGSCPFCFALLILTLSSAACGSMQRAMAELPESAPEVITVSEVDLKMRSAPFEVGFADVINDYLVLNLSYSGGCEEHQFEVMSNGKYTATYPPEITLYIKHNDNNDRCRGIIDEKRYFDLRPLQYPGTNRIRLIFAHNNRILDYIY